VLAIPVPQPEVVVVETLPVVSALDETLEALSVKAGTTVEEIKELLSASYTGDLDASLVQIRGRTATSFLSIKLGAISDPSAVLMEYVSTRMQSMHEMMRPPMPATVSELRLKLAVGVVPKVVAAPAPAAVDSDFAAATKAKLLAATKRAQENDGKLPEDMQKLMTANGTCIITNFRPPAEGKKNGGKVCRNT
jgi:hypothetical protein